MMAKLLICHTGMCIQGPESWWIVEIKGPESWWNVEIKGPESWRIAKSIMIS